MTTNRPGTGLLIGADVGGTTTRLALADRTGHVLAVAEQPAGNPNAVGVETSAARIRTAIDQLNVPSGARIDALLLGMAGFATAQQAGDAFVTAAIPAAFGVRPRIVSDLAVAFSSATPRPSGTVVIAGTGSGAALIDSGEIVARRGAWGWLLGDEGAGFWLGREAVRQTLIEVEREADPGRRGPLTRRVIEQLQVDPEAPISGLVRVPYLQTPVRLADLAPAVTELADQDPVAADICSRAADQLAMLALDLHPVGGRPVVVSGSVLQAEGPIRAAFIDRLDRNAIGPVLDARSGLVGALWLATATRPDGRPANVNDAALELSTGRQIHAQFLSEIG